jgi:hypothetical protein
MGLMMVFEFQGSDPKGFANIDPKGFFRDRASCQAGESGISRGASARKTFRVSCHDGDWL